MYNSFKMVQYINDLISDIIISNLNFYTDFFIKINESDYLLKYNNYIE